MSSLKKNIKVAISFISAAFLFTCVVMSLRQQS